MLYDINSSLSYSGVEAFRAAHPQTSFGPLITAEDLASVGLVRPREVFPPKYNAALHDLQLQGVTKVGGEWVAEYVISSKQLTDEQLKSIVLSQCDAALTAHLDATARIKHYDNRVTCALRAGYPGPFQTEGMAFAQWMDACNWQAYQIMKGVQSGSMTMPTVAEFIGDMPAMVWPG